MDVGCVARHCALKIPAVMVDPTFYKESACELGCNDFYWNSTDPAKLEYQNCTTKCALTYESEANDALMACAMNHNCIEFAPIEVTCPVAQLEAAIEPGSSLASLAGEWWQQLGKNALWDCYPCQHIHEMKLIDDSDWCAQTVGPDGPVQAPCWSYTYSYDLYTMTGSKYFQQTWQLPNVEPGKPIDIFYEYMGSTHNETWYILATDENFVVLVDCSYMSGWTNVGSILWVKPEYNLTDADTEKIAEVYMNALGWEYPNDFCYDLHDNEQCETPENNTKDFKFINE